MLALGFAAPTRLWFLTVVAGLAVAYLAVQRRRARDAARFANPALLPLLSPNRVGWWRHLIALVFVAGLVLATLGAAQPTMAGTVEEEQATIILAIDTSDSMKATDVSPSRLGAAVEAAHDFIGELPATFHVGLVTANSRPAVVVAPTTDHQLVQAALDQLETSPGTALGEAIFTALAAVPETVTAQEGSGPAAQIVLLSDGITTTGRPDDEAIAAAVEAGVPVSTIAFGTDQATVESAGQTVDVPVDSSALEAIAEGTGGTFFTAATADELASVYQAIDSTVTFVEGDKDIAEWFAAAALLVLVVAALVSLLTTARVVWA